MKLFILIVLNLLSSLLLVSTSDSVHLSVMKSARVLQRSIITTQPLSPMRIMKWLISRVFRRIVTKSEWKLSTSNPISSMFRSSKQISSRCISCTFSKVLRSTSTKLKHLSFSLCLRLSDWTLWRSTRIYSTYFQDNQQMLNFNKSIT